VGNNFLIVDPPYSSRGNNVYWITDNLPADWQPGNRMLYLADIAGNNDTSRAWQMWHPTCRTIRKKDFRCRTWGDCHEVP
jgi:hypothetical protein